MEQQEHLYPVSYNARQEQAPLTKEQLQSQGLGGCDALVLVSIMRGHEKYDPHAGPKSIAIKCIDGRPGQQMPPTELYQVILNLCQHIEGDHTAPRWQRMMCAEMFRQTLMLIKGDQTGPIRKLPGEGQFVFRDEIEEMVVLAMEHQREVQSFEQLKERPDFHLSTYRGKYPGEKLSQIEANLDKIFGERSDA